MFWALNRTSFIVKVDTLNHGDNQVWSRHLVLSFLLYCILIIEKLKLSLGLKGTFVRWNKFSYVMHLTLVCPMMMPLYHGTYKLPFIIMWPMGFKGIVPCSYHGARLKVACDWRYQHYSSWHYSLLRMNFN